MNLQTLTFLAGTADPIVGQTVLNETMKTAISQAIANLSATVSDVLLIAVPAIAGIIALSVGANFALSKIRSLGSWAS